MKNDAVKENGEKKDKKSYVALKIISAVVAVILVACLFLQIGTWSTHGKEGNFVPDYEKADITALLNKDKLSRDDYDLLYRQTGLTEIGIERELKREKKESAKSKKFKTRFLLRAK